MNVHSTRDLDAVTLIEIVDLKWLLAGEGFHLHVERLQNDTGYAQQVLKRASESKNAALRAVAERLRQRLGLDAPA